MIRNFKIKISYLTEGSEYTFQKWKTFFLISQKYRKQWFFEFTKKWPGQIDFSNIESRNILRAEMKSEKLICSGHFFVNSTDLCFAHICSEYLDWISVHHLRFTGCVLIYSVWDEDKQWPLPTAASWSAVWYTIFRKIFQNDKHGSKADSTILVNRRK